MRKAVKKSGFTLVEIMIVVFIIALLMAIAVPNFIHARDRARDNSCLKNLELIDNAKMQLSMQCGKNTGECVNWSDIIPDYLQAQPVCPSGGTYTPQLIGDNPTCTIEGHQL